MDRAIIAFNQDETGHWRAILSCGHRQHVRHDPPLVRREWVLSEEGRASRIGVELDCVKCDAWMIVLQTPRLLLRRLEPDDVEALVELDADPEVTRYVHLTEPTTAERARAWLASMSASYYSAPGGFGFWAICERDTGRFIGWYHLKRVDADPAAGEIGYRLRRGAWGKGYATEVSGAVIDYAFTELGLARITAKALVANVASTRVMEKLGMSLRHRFQFASDEAVEYDVLKITPPA